MTENKEEQEENAKNKINYFNFNTKNKYEMKNLLKDKSFSESLNFGKLKSYKHMKSLLGHISVIDDNIINPVPIYCIGFAQDNELVFTGDNNG
jgi:hypothetical protein